MEKKFLNNLPDCGHRPVILQACLKQYYMKFKHFIKLQKHLCLNVKQSHIL